MTPSAPDSGTTRDFTGRSPVRIEFDYVDQTEPSVFSADETCDVGDEFG